MPDKAQTRFGAPIHAAQVYDLKCLSDRDRARYEKLASNTARARFLNGSGRGQRPTFDCPSFDSMSGQELVLGGPKQGGGNAWIVFGLDRTGFARGWGSKQSSHCAAIDIVAGRQGFAAASHEKNGTPIVVDPSFIDDAARVYLSQRCDIDSAFGLPGGRGSAAGSPQSLVTGPSVAGADQDIGARSAVGIKADKIRVIGRENIKFITRTDQFNSQGGNLTNAITTGYGIDLIACEDMSTLQPMVRGSNLTACIGEVLDRLKETLSLFNTYISVTRKIHREVITHTHQSPFYAAKTSPDFTGIMPQGINAMVENVTKNDVGVQKIQTAITTTRTAFLEATGMETTEDEVESFNILSPYNRNN